MGGLKDLYVVDVWSISKKYADCYYVSATSEENAVYECMKRLDNETKEGALGYDILRAYLWEE